MHGAHPSRRGTVSNRTGGRAVPNRRPDTVNSTHFDPIPVQTNQIVQGKLVVRRGRKARGLAASETARPPIPIPRSALHKEVPLMFKLRKITTLGTAAVVALALSAAPASAKQPPKGEFDYYAQLDCGSGAMEVGSGSDLWSTFVD